MNIKAPITIYPFLFRLDELLFPASSFVSYWWPNEPNIKHVEKKKKRAAQPIKISSRMIWHEAGMVIANVLLDGYGTGASFQSGNRAAAAATKGRVNSYCSSSTAIPHASLYTSIIFLSKLTTAASSEGVTCVGGLSSTSLSLFFSPSLSPFGRRRRKRQLAQRIQWAGIDLRL